jgi:hypothetical protein
MGWRHCRVSLPPLQIYCSFSAPIVESLRVLAATTVIIRSRGNQSAFHLSSAALGFATLPLIYWLLVAVILATYATLTTQRRSGSLA